MSAFDGYLDAAATAPLRPEARAAMLEVLGGGPGNPSSVHAFGHRARTIVEDARTTLAEAFGVRQDEVVFTGGGTEANNLGVIGAALAEPRGRHIVTTPIEHSSVRESCRFLERAHGFDLTLLPVDTAGRVDPDEAASVLRENTTLVTIGLANAEVGTVQPVPEIAAIARQRGVPVHTDAVQAAPSLPVSLGQEGFPGEQVDAMTLASHKFGGPQGVGALLVRSHMELEPVLHGGGQEGGARPGTENVAGIAGFAAAVSALQREGVGNRALALMQCRDELIAAVVAAVPGARLTGHAEERQPGHASFVVETAGGFSPPSGESLLVALDAAGFAASSGSACAMGSNEPSPVLLAMGLDPVLAQTAIRITLSAPLEPEGIERVVAVLAAEARR